MQPLPLPQGVSDLAVGDRAAKLAMPAAMVGRFVAQESAVGKVASPARDEEVDGGGCLEKAARGWRFPTAGGDSTVTLTLNVVAAAARVERVETRGALAAAEAERVVRERLRPAGGCLAGFAPGRWVVVLSVGADGRVVRVRVI